VGWWSWVYSLTHTLTGRRFSFLSANASLVDMMAHVVKLRWLFCKLTQFAGVRALHKSRLLWKVKKDDPLISTCTAGIKQSNLIDEDRWVCDPFWHVRYLNISLLLAFSPLYIDMPNLSQSMLQLLFTSSMSSTGPVAIKSFSQAGVMANSWAFTIPICHHVLFCIVFAAPLWWVANGILRSSIWGCSRV
jgi:hypothetical protein